MGRIRRIAVLAWLVAGFSGTGEGTPVSGETTRLGRLPLSFVENRGQWDAPARFVARRGGRIAYLASDSVTLQLVRRESAEGTGEGSVERVRGTNLRLVFEGSDPSVRLVGRDEQAARHHYFLGDEPTRWRAEVPGYGRIAYEGLYPGVDLVVREEEGRLEYDLLLAPGASLERVAVRVEGASDPIRLDEEGDLLFETEMGSVHQPRPRTWEERPSGERRDLACAYRVLGEDRFGFAVPGRDAGSRLVIDPGLVYSTYLGASVFDHVTAVAVDPATGEAVLAGPTSSTTFPTTPGAFDTTYNGGTADVFVARLAANGGSLVWSTFLGGSGSEGEPRLALAMDAAGVVTLAGPTASANFPTTAGAFATAHAGGTQDVFVTRLAAAGNALAWSTYLGGNGSDGYFNIGIALAASGEATLTGRTTSTNFPTTAGAFDTTWNGIPATPQDAFVSRLSSSGANLAWSTYLGGSSNDDGEAVTVDASGNAYVVGYTFSGNFPVTAGAFDTTYDAQDDAFVAKISPNGSALLWSTYLGGSASDSAESVGLTPTGVVVAGGETYSATFPTTPGVFQPTIAGGSDLFVTGLAPSGAFLFYSTFLGGPSNETHGATVLDAIGAPTSTGQTLSTAYPVTAGAFSSTAGSGGDGFVSTLLPGGIAVTYSGYLGGASIDSGSAVALDGAGGVVVAGFTASSDYPTTTGAFSTAFAGNVDAFVTRLDRLYDGVAAFGASTPGCLGPVAAGVNSMPQVGNASFALTCTGASPGAGAILGFSGATLPAPLVIFGAGIWIDLANPAFFILTVSAGASGSAVVPLPVPLDPSLAGSQIFAQFFWIGPSSPPPCPPFGVSASQGIGLTVQP